MPKPVFYDEEGKAKNFRAFQVLRSPRDLEFQNFAQEPFCHPENILKIIFIGLLN